MQFIIAVKCIQPLNFLIIITLRREKIRVSNYLVRPICCVNWKQSHVVSLLSAGFLGYPVWHPLHPPSTLPYTSPTTRTVGKTWSNHGFRRLNSFVIFIWRRNQIWSWLMLHSTYYRTLIKSIFHYLLKQHYNLSSTYVISRKQTKLL